MHRGDLTPGRPSTPPTQQSEVADGADETVRAPRTGLPEIGDVIGRRWRVDAVIGSGGMAQVFAAFDQQAGEDVALKVLAPVLGADAESLERFHREQRALASLTTPHCVRIRDVGALPNGLPFMTMELLRGKDLGHLLAEGGPLPISDACIYVAQACVALAEAHRAGLVHRDLKPGNLFLAQEEGKAIVRVLDFGVARMLGRLEVRLETITKAGSVVGTLSYMAPEQIRSSHHVDARADIWALGACLYKLLANRPPFLPTPDVSLVEAIHGHAPTSLVALRPDVSDALERIVLRCLQKDPAARYASAEALATALDEVRSKLRSSGGTELHAPLQPPICPATEPGAPSAAFAVTAPLVERTVTAHLPLPPVHPRPLERAPVPVELVRVPPPAAPRRRSTAVTVLLGLAAFVLLFALGAGLGVVLFRR